MCVGHQERLARIESEVADEEQRQWQEMAYKKQRIDSAVQKHNAPIDDSKMVDEVFGFVDQSSDLYDGKAPSAFQVCDFCHSGVCNQAGKLSFPWQIWYFLCRGLKFSLVVCSCCHQMHREISFVVK